MHVDGFRFDLASILTRGSRFLSSLYISIVIPHLILQFSKIQLSTELSLHFLFVLSAQASGILLMFMEVLQKEICLQLARL